MKPKSRSSVPRSTTVIVAASVVVSCFFVMYLYQTKQRLSALALRGHDLLSERERLIEHVTAWNIEAKNAGIDTNLYPLALAGDTDCSVSKESTQKVSDIDRYCQGDIKMKTKEEVTLEDPVLADLVAKHAKNNEILLALANAVMICQNKTVCWWEGGNILESFLRVLKHANISNYIIGVLDDETEAYLKPKGVNYFRPNVTIPKSQDKTREANRVSTVKYILLQRLIQLGYHTLVSDMDLVYIQNPFDHLHRDSDIEGQTDGFDDMAYGLIEGIHDASMGWGGGGLYVKIFTINVGCVYVRATCRSYALVKAVYDSLSVAAAWDQQVFNEIAWTQSHGATKNPNAHIRIMDYMLWVNSKVFFKSRRQLFLPGAKATAHTPIMVHFNYHPDKHARMLCVMDRYLDGKLSACDKFPGGSEPNT